MAEFEIEIDHDGQAALTRLAAITPAIVILDLHLPRISGQTILQQIRADERLAKMRVILTTADALRAESLRREADLVLLKPISFYQLRDLAKRLRSPYIVGSD
jgi:CheY-like chemotaxis protein